MSDLNGGDSLLNMTLGDLLALLRPSNTVGVGAGVDPERWLDLRDDDFPVNPRLVWAAAKRGELDVSRVGNATLVKARELDRWLLTQRYEPEKDAARDSTKPPISIAHLVADSARGAR